MLGLLGILDRLHTECKQLLRRAVRVPDAKLQRVGSVRKFLDSDCGILDGDLDIVIHLDLFEGFESYLCRYSLLL